MKKKFKVLDLFAGAGGFGLGFSLIKNKFNVVCSLEIDEWAVETLKANNLEGQKIICDDIRNYQTSEEIKAACPYNIDVIIGGPPCQGFSQAGPIKDANDPRNSLFLDFARWVEVLSPSVFVIENVKGILNRTNATGEKVIDIIKQTFINLEYHIDIWELNAVHFGVPQNRERIFIVGNKYGRAISKPKAKFYLPEERKTLNGHAKKMTQAITVSKAISDLPTLSAGEGEEEAIYTKQPKNQFQIWARSGQEILANHVTMDHTKRVVERYKQIIEGQAFSELPDEFKVMKRNGNGLLSDTEYKMNYRHLKPNSIAYTIPASFYSNFIHPYQPRNITSREAARLQSFPDWYIFKGKRTQISSKLLARLGKDDEDYLSQYNQIGNAVPPLLSKTVATRIANFLGGTNKKRKTKGKKKLL